MRLDFIQRGTQCRPILDGQRVAIDVGGNCVILKSCLDVSVDRKRFEVVGLADQDFSDPVTRAVQISVEEDPKPRAGFCASARASSI